MVYWSFGDFIKSSSFCTINTLDISNTDLAKAKMSRLKIVSFIISKNKSTENLPKLESTNFFSERKFATCS